MSDLIYLKKGVWIYLKKGILSFGGSDAAKINQEVWRRAEIRWKALAPNTYQVRKLELTLCT
jgi:hypothetical protein